MDNFIILLIDDNPDDRELVIREIKRVFTDAVITQASDQNTFEKEFNKGNFSLIITDYQLKWSNGIEILKKAKEFNPLIPVIMFTGTGNEEIAVEAMKLGLDDYVVKSTKHFKRLPFSIKLVLDKMEQKKRQIKAEKNYQNLFQNLPIGIIVFLPNGSILDINNYAINMLGYLKNEVIQNINLKNIFFDNNDYNKFIVHLQKSAEIIDYETQLKHKNGSAIWTKINAKNIYEHGKLHHIEASIKNTTIEKIIESQLIQSQKLEAIGFFATKIVHDFNNILTPIIGYTDILLLNPFINDTTKEYLKLISNLTENAANLAKQLLIFAKRKKFHLEILSINQIINEISNTFQKFIGENIIFNVELPSENLWLKADKSQLQQIILNLIINAREAMPQGGYLSIKIEKIELRKNNPLLPSEAKPGNYILISVKDTGKGMDKETLSYIFDAFFSSKLTEKGTGLGLSIVNSLVKKYKGWINVESEINKGTCFKIFLPEYKGKTKIEPAKMPELIDYEKLIGNGETILILEDEVHVRDYMKTILTKKNYKVYEASTYKEAYKIFSQKKEPINILLCDLKLPDKNGIEASKEFLKIEPNMKIIISTGYIDKDEEIDQINSLGWCLLQKPYTSVMLLKTIKKLLE